MNDRRSSPDLGPNAEALLGAFPFPERDWESDARAVEARLPGLGSTDALLLAAPLPGEPEEPSAVSATATPMSSSGVRTQSLAELARRSVEKKQANDRAMARESLAIAAQQQRPSEGRSQTDATSAPSVATAVGASVSRVQQTRAPLPAPASAASAAPVIAASAPSPWPRAALVAVPVLALAAAVLLWLERPEPTPLITSALPVATSEAKPGAAAGTTFPGAAAAPNAPSLPNTPSGVDPSTLPGEGPTKVAEVARSKAAAPIAAAASPSARPTSETVELADDVPAAAPVAAAPVEKPIEKGLPPDPALRPADSSGGEVPAKPSTGAVQAALGAVMSGARHCVAGDDAPSSAVVVFGSDGHVQRVSVSGPAAGQASGACIEAQLGHARVQPFAASSFSVNATVRP